jgi:tetratricopeptide (TPR) repeat protein
MLQLFAKKIGIAICFLTFYAFQVVGQEISDLSYEQRVVYESSLINGMKSYLTEDYTIARENFEKCIELFPNAFEPWFQLSAVSIKENALEKGLLEAQKALELNKDNPFIYERLAYLYTELRDYSKAISTLETLVDQVPGTMQYYYNLADLYTRAGRFEQAIQAYDSLEANFGISEQISGAKQNIFLVKLNDPGRAIEEGYKLAEYFPESDNYVSQLAFLLINNNRFQEAIKLIESHYGENHENGFAHVMLADLYRRQGKLKLYFNSASIAIKDPKVSFESKLPFIRDIQRRDSDLAKELASIASDLHPDNGQAQAYLADHLTFSKDYRSARNKYVESIATNPGNFLVWERIIQLDFELGEMDSAMIHAERAMDYFPNQAKLHYMHGISLAAQHLYDEALFSFEQALSLNSDPKLAREISNHLAGVYHHLEDYGESDRIFKELLATNPEDIAALNNYSYYLAERESQLELALELSEKLMALDGGNANHKDTYGWVLYKLKRFEDASRVIQQALEIKQDDPTIIEHFGDVLFNLGEIEEALKQWEKAKRVSGKSSDKLNQKIAEKRLIE